MASWVGVAERAAADQATLVLYRLGLAVNRLEDLAARLEALEARLATAPEPAYQASLRASECEAPASG